MSTYASMLKTDGKSVSSARTISLVLTVCLVTAMFGKPLFGMGKLAISNVAQIAIFGLLFFKAPLFGFRQFLVLAALLLTSLIAGVYTYFEYGVFGKPLVVFFVLISVGFVFLAINLYEYSDFDIGGMQKAVRPAIYLTAVLYVLVVVDEIWVGDGVSLGMDDKSHASIYLGFLSFLSLRFLDKGRYFFALYFLFLSLFSISRLSFVFAPFIFCMIFVLILQEGSFATKVKTAIILAVLFSVAVWFIQDNPDYFKVLDRVSSADEIAGSDSSQAHKILLQKGFELKFSDAGLFLLGTSPGMFSDVLVRSGVNFTDLSILDPNFIAFAWEGKAPIHSTHMAILSEYSIFVFMAYVVYIGLLFWRALALREYMLILFMVPYLIAVLFYSAHNKFYFFVVAVVIEVSLRMARKARLADLSPGLSQAVPR